MREGRPCILSSNAEEDMSTVRYHVALVSQQFTPVCWLACAVMVIQFKRGYTPSAESLGIQDDFRFPSYTASGPLPATDGEQMAYFRRLGFTPCRSANVPHQRTTSTLEFSERRMAPRPMLVRVTEPSQPSEEVILYLLRNHGPFILNHYPRSFSYGPGVVVPAPRPGEPRTSHSVVVTGIDTTRHTVYFNNPWGQTDVAATTQAIVGAIRRHETENRIPFIYL
jgi:hypothetical protein